MRMTTAYFAGVGTVIAAIAAGLGGGLVLGDIMSPQQPKHQSSEVTRLEQRTTQPIPAVAGASQVTGASQPVPYLPTTQAAATVAEPPAQTPPQQPAPPQAAQTTQSSSQPADNQAQSLPSQKPDAATQSAAATPPQAPVEPSAARERAAPENAYAKARDSDVRREMSRAERRAERRAKWAERRQQWAERKRMKSRDDDDGLRDAEEKVRELTDPRESRPLFSREPGLGTRINLFED